MAAGAKVAVVQASAVVVVEVVAAVATVAAMAAQAPKAKILPAPPLLRRKNEVAGPHLRLYRHRGRRPPPTSMSLYHLLIEVVALTVG